MKSILITLLTITTFVISGAVTPEEFADRLVLQLNPVNADCIDHLKSSIKEDWKKLGGGPAIMVVIRDYDESEELKHKAIRLTHDKAKQILHLHMDSFLKAIHRRRLGVPPGELPRNFRCNAYMRLFERYVERPTKSDAHELWDRFLLGKIPMFFESAIPIVRKQYEDAIDILIGDVRNEFYDLAIKKQTQESV